MSKIECKECGIEFTYEPRRGRPPVKCDQCRLPKSLRRVSVTRKLSPTEIVDRLEMNLKSRNLHISQHRQEWE